jgi:plasmid maintenance system antidote protein VapI
MGLKKETINVQRKGLSQKLGLTGEPHGGSMKTKLWVFALMMVLAGPAWAQPQPGAEVLILPVEMPGYYNPVDSEGLTKTLQTSLRKMAPNANLQVSRAADLTAYGYVAGNEQPPTPEMADKLCRAYGASYVSWISIRFQPDFQRETGASGATVPISGR